MCNCTESTTLSSAGPPSAVPTPAGPVVPPGVPLAGSVELTPAPEGPLPGPGLPVPGPGEPVIPTPLPPFKLCKLDFRDGCYEITHRPSGSITTFQGTLRVDRAAPDGGADHIIVSGDLYTKRFVIGPTPPRPVGGSPAVPGDARAAVVPSPALSVAAAVSGMELAPIPLPSRPRIPIFPRSRYHAYLKVTSVSVPRVVPASIPCQVTLVAEQFDYTQPPAGQHKGTFPASPSRTVTIKLTPTAPPFPYSLTGGPYYEGRLFEGGVDKGSVTLAWVSRFFRRATLEIDTLTGAVAPAPVPDGAGGAEFFDTIFARIGWQLGVVSDQTGIPVPAGVTPTNCWSSANLHSLMTTVRNPSTDLDKEWRIHLVVVPAQLGCARGVMYDQIGVPREGCASFSDDGYPTSDSSNFGAAENQMQRNVPRAFLRSATHEVTHTLNQIHQEIETSADNSIMTTTPSVADVLGGPATGAPGVFPDQINLAQNTTVRHHLDHMPDPVIRPGGWPFSSWFPTGAPQASDRHAFSPSELELAVSCAQDRVALGQPVELSWTLTNRSAMPLRAPNDVSVEALFANITVTDGLGRERPVRPFAIVCERARLAVLAPGQSVKASSRVFWSSDGFAFERPGRYRVAVWVSWSAQGVLVGVDGGVDVFVDYPANDADNQAAGLVLNDEVGKWVALGGGAYHLKGAARRLFELSLAAGDAAAPRLLQGFTGLLPSRERLTALHPDVVADAEARRAARSRPR